MVRLFRCDQSRPVPRRCVQPGGLLLIWRNTGESPEQAKTRWHAEHPEKGDPDKPGARVLIVGWGDSAA